MQTGPPRVVPPQSTLASDLGAAAVFAGVFLLLGASAWLAGLLHVFDEPMANDAAVVLASLGLAFVVRAWWIGPVCARLDMVTTMLAHGREREAALLDRIARALEERNASNNPARATGAPPPSDA